MDIKKTLGNLKIDLSSIQDENLRHIIIVLLNAVEHLSNENNGLRKKVQEQADEINRLKGEQGKPKIRPEKKDKPDDKPDRDHSSEK